MSSAQGITYIGYHTTCLASVSLAVLSDNAAYVKSTKKRQTEPEYVTTHWIRVEKIKTYFVLIIVRTSISYTSKIESYYQEQQTKSKTRKRQEYVIFTLTLNNTIF